jgi:hypothetical protein
MANDQRPRPAATDGRNPRHVNRSAWIAGITAGLTIAAFGVLFLRSGLDASDKWASVLGAFLNVAGLMISAYSLILARRTSPSTSPIPAAQNSSTDQQSGDTSNSTAVAMPPAPADMNAPASRHDVAANSVHGNVQGPVIQSRDIIQGVSIHHRSPPRQNADDPDTPPS